MDEPAIFQVLRDQPDNESIRVAYFRWLEESGDSRALYVSLMHERRKLQEQVDDIDSRLREHSRHVSSDWLDTVFPLRVRSPMVGRCFLRPRPGADPFVKIGDHVAPNTAVCVIEAMKAFSIICAGFDGVVVAVSIADGDVVEYNQTLFRVDRLSIDHW